MLLYIRRLYRIFYLVEGEEKTDLVVPLRSFRLSWLSSLIRVNPPLYWFVKGFCILRVLPINASAAVPSASPASTANDFTYLAQSNNNHSQVTPLRLSVSIGGFIPMAIGTSSACPALAGLPASYAKKKGSLASLPIIILIFNQPRSSQ
jgi:hypothetical protein